LDEVLPIDPNDEYFGITPVERDSSEVVKKRESISNGGRKKFKKSAGLTMILDDYHERKHIQFDEDSLFELVFATGGKEK